SLLRSLWDDVRPNIVWTMLTLVLSSSLVAGFIATVKASAGSPISIGLGVGIFTISLVTFALLFLFERRHHLIHPTSAKASRMLLTYLPLAAAAVLLAWIYMMGSKVTQLET